LAATQSRTAKATAVAAHAVDRRKRRCKRLIRAPRRGRPLGDGPSLSGATRMVGLPGHGWWGPHL